MKGISIFIYKAQNSYIVKPFSYWVSQQATKISFLDHPKQNIEEENFIPSFPQENKVKKMKYEPSLNRNDVFFEKRKGGVSILPNYKGNISFSKFLKSEIKQNQKQ